jgi:glucose/arabinose dehydrogenase
MTTLALRALLAAIALCASLPPSAAIELRPVLAGLAAPVFVTNADDGSNRLFVVEQRGTILVAQPDTATASTFLDIQPKVMAGGERGLLGLAFHPRYATNGRFFVYYTRSPDGAIVIAEYAVSANPDVAGTAETVLLTIPHPTFANHNGGMLAFGPDHLLYVGVGDGGSANDPSNHAQDVDVLLGKILRIDVDRPDASTGTAYGIPADNPFVNAAGRDEIFAYGFRNPWRFSFDRVTGVQWVGDVGQVTREEVDMPIVRGGNYGWRVYEGFSCTGSDASLCTASRYRLPVFDYEHSAGRCSITGGHVYRGNDATLPGGTYVYGDYCSGEIFAWDGARQTLLLPTSLSIASFGEDEHGEIYVVDLNGTVSQIASGNSCTYAIAPAKQTFPKDGGAASVNVTAPPGCAWTAQSDAAWLSMGGSAQGDGNGTVVYTVAPYTGNAKTRTATITVAGRTLIVRQTKLRPLVRR